MKKLIILAFIILRTSSVFALANDKYGRTVTGPVTTTVDTYTDTDPVTGAVFALGFPIGAPLVAVYAGLEGMAPSNSNNYIGLDAAGNVIQPYFRYTQAMMDALVSGGAIASYQLMDPSFPPPPPGAQFNPGSGNGNYAVPLPYLPGGPANWPNPPPPPLTLPMALDRLSARVSNINPVASARALNSNFTPGPIRMIYACYTVRINCSITVGGTCTGTVALLSDVNTPPVANRGQALLSLGGVIVVGLTITESKETPLCYIVPAGHVVRLSTAVVAGSPTFSITQQVEEVMGPG